MSRRRKAVIREVSPDPKFFDSIVTKFMNAVMYDGKKSVAEKIVYGAFEFVRSKEKQDPIELFHKALSNVSPQVEVRTRRVGGATYSVPGEVGLRRSQALAIRWIISAARKRNETTMIDRLGGEIADASNNRGIAVKKREETHKVAESNRAFMHFRF
ncbi:30S ribosomal protein S7 [Candidatus Liberibacter americanus]|uniref:Small ribosomal subunit protein uS7 n=1 Tax=Candidatus Liberibacter americanus str. Sao Paulo TaxID=1261131 RepID=U6B679_9HYPH|nr:30S ribosomal protein S7 [Candidatus Liberibacter americanus]AHA28279.1 Ribosomal protein S7 [Candidatus Liberibacter americanus str. Sao Paulo]EMS36207.1 30S ribosomal protein S7 [Candidatus Liberibacter americanus PW_SP]